MNRPAPKTAADPAAKDAADDAALAGFLRTSTVYLEPREFFTDGTLTLKGVMDEIDRLLENPEMELRRQLRRELAAGDRDARVMRLARRHGERLVRDARAFGIPLDGDRWIPAASLAPHAGRLTKLFNSLSFSPAYREWQADRTDDLAHTLALDDHFRMIAREWHRAHPALLMEYARYVSERQQKTFMRGIGAPHAISAAYYFEARRGHGDDVRLVRGSHARPRHGGDNVHHLQFNVHPDTGFGHAATGLNVVFHENWHAVQWTLACLYANGDLDPAHPLYRDARLLFMAFGERLSYVPAVKPAYRAHPTEEDAFRASDAFIAALEKPLARYGIDLAAPLAPVPLLTYRPQVAPS